MSNSQQMDKLTSRQREVYEFIRDKIRTRGYGPTVREIGTHFHISSPNGVMCHLRALERKGWLKREPYLARSITLVETEETNLIPLVGVIQAGRPVFSDEISDHYDVGDLSGPGRFALHVEGESMRNVILPGSTVIVQLQDTAEDGQIVVAVADGEHTLKRYRKHLDDSWLEPENDRYDAIRPRELRILGVVVAAIQRFQ